MKVKKYLIGVKIIPVTFDIEKEEDELTIEKLSFRSIRASTGYAIVSTVCDTSKEANDLVSRIIEKGY